jgi:serine/threonine protein kinase
MENFEWQFEDIRERKIGLWSFLLRSQRQALTKNIIKRHKICCFSGKLEGKAPICTAQPSVVTRNFENCEVAVKKLPEYADDLAKNDFIQEINFMKRIGYHSHLVSILGCITDPSVDPCLVIEYCANGDLLKYVRNRQLEIVKVR